MLITNSAQPSFILRPDGVLYGLKSLIKMLASRQQKCGLAFAAVCCLLFGGGITACGFLFEYLEPYDTDTVNGKSYVNNDYEYYYTQYWLGIPVISLGILLLCSLCVRVKCMFVFCMVVSVLTLVLSIAGVVLEGPKWRSWISTRRYVVHNDKKEINGTCVMKNGLSIAYGLSCKEVYYATLMQSIVVACAILCIVLSQFTAFVSIRIIGWMPQGSYDMNHKGDNPKNYGYNSGSSNVVITSEM